MVFIITYIFTLEENQNINSNLNTMCFLSPLILKDAFLQILFSLCAMKKIESLGNSLCLNTVLYKCLRLMGSKSSYLLRYLKFAMPLWLRNHTFCDLEYAIFIGEYGYFHIHFCGFVLNHDPSYFNNHYHLHWIR